MVTLEATGSCIVRGYGQYNKGDKVCLSDEQALDLLDQFPDGWRECHREDATQTKAPTAPPVNKMVKTAERKK